MVAEWIDGVAGDTATFTIAVPGEDAAMSMSTSNGEADRWRDSGNELVVQVPVGKAVSLNQSLGEENAGEYTESFSCTPMTSGVFCLYVYMNATQTLTVQTTWVNGVAGDTADLTAAVVGEGYDPVLATSTSNGNAGEWTDSDSAMVIQVPVGTSVSLSEALGEDDAGDYTGRVTCDNGDPVTDGMLVMPRTPVKCTFTNTNATQTLTVQKDWVNGVAGDTADLTVAVAGDGYLPVSATSTSNGAVGSWTDTANAVSATVPVGKSVSVTEALEGEDPGAYTGALTCEGADPDRNGMFDMPGEPVTCTFTNTHPAPLIPLTPASLPNTGSSVPVAGLLGGSAGLIALGGLVLFLVWRRRNEIAE